MTAVPPNSAAAACCWCRATLAPDALYCASCGRRASRIEWALEGVRPASGAADAILLEPGGAFYLVATNRGPAPVRSAVDLTQAVGVKLMGPAAFPVQGGAVERFELRHIPGQVLGGVVRARSEDGARAEWWTRASWRVEERKLPGPLRLRDRAWVLGAPSVVFPPGVTTQYVRVWNDASTTRELVGAPPSGYDVLCYGGTLATRAVPVEAGSSVELAVLARPLGPAYGEEPEWRPAFAEQAVPLVRLPGGQKAPGADVIVAIDFGTRNTGIRVRWRRTLIPTKPAGTVDTIGDAGSASRFPTEMILRAGAPGMVWGTEAAEYRGILKEGMVRVANLKTYLRERDEHYARLQAEWTNQELLNRYFEKIFDRIDAYFKSADPNTPLTRSALSMRCVITRPVMDANRGDETGAAYEQALQRALARCGVAETAISFIHEPVAAAIGILRRHEDELADLPDGAVIAVIDSGGGTTDVAIARIRLQGGRLDLEISGSYAVHLPADSPAVGALEACDEVDRLEFGGNTLDAMLATRLTTDAGSLLESDGAPVPRTLASSGGPDPRPLVPVCKRLKEGFAWASKLYLNRPRGQASRAGEVLPFPTRADYEGVYLEQSLFDEALLAPVLTPALDALTREIEQGAAAAGGLRSGQVRRIFCVGGTNTDPLVRRRFGRAFPDAKQDGDGGAQDADRIAERLNAVVEGAVWCDEHVFTPSPLSLELRIREERVPLIAEGGVLPPAGAASTRFTVCAVSGWERLDAELIASGTGLSAPTPVARAFYVNSSPEAIEVVLRTSLSREKGAVSAIMAEGSELPQWRFQLVGATP